jgi:hypothetical protein
MTWAFAFLVCLVLGLVLSGISGLLAGLPFPALHRHLVVPEPEHRTSSFNTLARRVGVGLAVFGAMGLVLSAWVDFTLRTTLAAALAAAGAATLVVALLLRRRCAVAAAAEYATVVREIPPGGYGQVRFQQGESVVVMAARSDDPASIPTGSAVEVVDCLRSVVTVRLVTVEAMPE